MNSQCKENTRHRCDQTYLLKFRWRQEPRNHNNDNKVWEVGDPKKQIKSQQPGSDPEGVREKLSFSSLHSPAEQERREKVKSSQQELRRRRRRRLTGHTTPPADTSSTPAPLPAAPPESTRGWSTGFRDNSLKKPKNKTGRHLVIFKSVFIHIWRLLRSWRAPTGGRSAEDFRRSRVIKISEQKGFLKKKKTKKTPRNKLGFFHFFGGFLHRLSPSQNLFLLEYLMCGHLGVKGSNRAL